MTLSYDLGYICIISPMQWYQRHCNRNIVWHTAKLSNDRIKGLTLDSQSWKKYCRLFHTISIQKTPTLKSWSLTLLAFNDVHVFTIITLRLACLKIGTTESIDKSWVRSKFSLLFDSWDLKKCVIVILFKLDFHMQYATEHVINGLFIPLTFTLI